MTGGKRVRVQLRKAFLFRLRTGRIVGREVSGAQKATDEQINQLGSSLSQELAMHKAAGEKFTGDMEAKSPRGPVRPTRSGWGSWNVEERVSEVVSFWCKNTTRKSERRKDTAPDIF